MTPLATWALVVVVLATAAVLTAGPVPRKVRARETRDRTPGEGATRRRGGDELHVVDHQVEGWFVPEVAGHRSASREATRFGGYPLPITRRREDAA